MNKLYTFLGVVVFGAACCAADFSILYDLICKSDEASWNQIKECEKHLPSQGRQAIEVCVHKYVPGVYDLDLMRNEGCKKDMEAAKDIFQCLWGYKDKAAALLPPADVSKVAKVFQCISEVMFDSGKLMKP